MSVVLVVTGQVEERQYGLGLAKSMVKDYRKVQDEMAKETTLVWDMVGDAQDEMVKVMVSVWDLVVVVQGERTKKLVDRRTKEQVNEEDAKKKGYVNTKNDGTRELKNVKNEEEGGDELRQEFEVWNEWMRGGMNFEWKLK